MKRFVLIVVAASLSACASAPKSKANLAIDSEPTQPMEAREPEVTPAPTDEPAPRGEISLGIEGGGTGEVVVESGGEEPVATPSGEEVPAESADEEEEGKEADEEEKAEADAKAKKKKPTGWATGNDESDFEPDPE